MRVNKRHDVDKAYRVQESGQRIRLIDENHQKPECVLISLCSVDPSWDQREVIVKQGQDKELAITCTINLGRDPFGVVRIFRQVKIDGKVTETVIAENEEVKEPYASTGRYSVDYSQDPSTDNNIAVLTIHDIRGEDAGKYGCLSIDDDEYVAWVQVEVEVPVSDVYMISITDATEIQAAEGATLHLEEGKAKGVGCVVTVDGGLEPPKVVLTLDGEDRTDLFTPLIDSKRLKDNDNEPEKYYTEVKYTYVTVVPSSELNQKNLTCIASSYNFPSRHASVYIDVKYKPVITCPQYVIYAPKGEGVSLKCVLHSNPGAMVTWSYGADKVHATEVDPGNANSRMSIKESPFTEDGTNIELLIDKVSSKHFTNFYLTATNDLGTTEVSLSLKKASGSTPQPKYNPGNPPSNTVGNPQQNPKADSVHSNTSPASLTLGHLLFLVHVCALLTVWSQYL
ncbi:hypothetical protein LSH36_679g00012 [Paralvinella palmiformis]|uniref:Ig-like domain-containing protein n=1 Tax=Paralvinella palmiformis TaxID=53620 RepID=A0AAD9J3S2_9ANNE|nr:hypothetical protein LSH36_679g00012 [Paralvinella palmiformis]